MTKLRVMVDRTGRVVIPVNWRKELGIKNGSMVEMHKEGDSVVVRNATTICAFCGCVVDDTEKTKLLHKNICDSCRVKVSYFFK